MEPKLTPKAQAAFNAARKEVRREVAKRLILVLAMAFYLLIWAFSPFLISPLLNLGPNAAYVPMVYDVFLLFFLAMLSLFAVVNIFKKRVAFITPNSTVKAAIYLIGAVLLLGTAINPLNALMLALDTAFLTALLIRHFANKPYLIFALMLNISILFATSHIAVGEASITRNFIGLTVAEIRYADVDYLEYRCHYYRGGHTAENFRYRSINLVLASGETWTLSWPVYNDRLVGLALSKLPRSSYLVDANDCNFDVSSLVQEDLSDLGFSPERILEII